MGLVCYKNGNKIVINIDVNVVFGCFGISFVGGKIMFDFDLVYEVV